jgi:hypothetical protein
MRELLHQWRESRLLGHELSLNERIREYGRRIEKMANQTYPETELLKQDLSAQFGTFRIVPTIHEGSSALTVQERLIG